MHDLYLSGFEPPTEIGLSIGIPHAIGECDRAFCPKPNTNHPTVAQNFYRMSGLAGNDARLSKSASPGSNTTYGAAFQRVGYGCLIRGR